MGRYLQLADNALLEREGVVRVQYDQYDLNDKSLRADPQTAETQYDRNDLNDQRLPHDVRMPNGLRRTEHAATPDPSSFEERAGIAEHDGGLPRAWAEGLAQLCTMHPPAGVPLPRWQTFVNDCARFADHWAGQANALGWAALELFGCDDTRPNARIDKQGLCWLLDGSELLALTSDAATIRTASGSTLTYYRKANKDEAHWVLAWQLRQDEK